MKLKQALINTWISPCGRTQAFKTFHKNSKMPDTALKCQKRTITTWNRSSQTPGIEVWPFPVLIFFMAQGVKSFQDLAEVVLISGFCHSVN
jgi:hypothetical protein